MLTRARVKKHCGNGGVNMSMIEANWLPNAGDMVYGKSLSDKKKAEIKAMYIEALIKFTDIYAQTELGDDIEIDIMKVALYVNSPQFENQNVYTYRNINDIYKELETLVLAGLPIWRFLRLSPYQREIFEADYQKLLVELQNEAAKKCPCYGCIWYREDSTIMGNIAKCGKPSIGFRTSFERTVFTPEKIKSCEWLTTLDTVPTEALDKHNIVGFDRGRFIDEIPTARKRYTSQLYKDAFCIPKTLSDAETVDLSEETDLLMDFALALGNKRTKSERKKELRKAMYMEGMIRFFEIFARSEIGNNYVADIKKIAMYVNKKLEWDESLNKMDQCQ